MSLWKCYFNSRYINSHFHAHRDVKSADCIETNKHNKDQMSLKNPREWRAASRRTFCKQITWTLSVIWQLMFKKSCCIRIGPRNRAICVLICCLSGVSLPWADELRYLGIFVIRSRVLKISLDHAQKVFIALQMLFFGKVGRVANEDVVLQLLSSKCLQFIIVCFGLEVCPFVTSDLSSLDFVINRFFMKLFKTNNFDVVKTCQQYFNFEILSTLSTKRSASFENFSSSENVFCEHTRYLI